MDHMNKLGPFAVLGANRFPCLRSKRASVITAAVSGLLVLLGLLLWHFEIGAYQDHLDILNGGSSSVTDTNSLIYRDCSHLADSWGTVVSSHGLMHSATFVFAASNGAASPSKVDKYILKTQCSVRPHHIATVYVAAPHLHAFSKIVHLVPFPFALVSGDADITVPQDVRGWEDITECPNVLRWFAQNVGYKDAATRPGLRKLRYLPIGLDLHSLHSRASAVQHWGPPADPMAQTAQLDAVLASSVPFSERLPLAYCNFQLNQPKKSFFFSDREEAERVLARKGPEVAYLQSTVQTRANSWKEQSAYAFVASPHGVGLDCHRTWEAMALGSVPIVKTSPLDSLYEDLPVLIVDSWESVTPELLRDKQKEFAGNAAWFGIKGTRPEQLSLKFWMSRVSQLDP